MARWREGNGNRNEEQGRRRGVEKAIIALLLVFIASCSALFYISVNTGPLGMDIEDIGLDDVGRKVGTGGYVRWLDRGGKDGSGASFELVDISRDPDRVDSIWVYVHSIAGGLAPELTDGARVHVVGKVEEYRGRLELSIRDKDRIDVEWPAGVPRFGGWELCQAGMASELDGLVVTVEGTVWDLHYVWGQARFNITMPGCREGNLCDRPIQGRIDEFSPDAEWKDGSIIHLTGKFGAKDGRVVAHDMTGVTVIPSPCQD